MSPMCAVRMCLRSDLGCAYVLKHSVHVCFPRFRQYFTWRVYAGLLRNCRLQNLQV